MTREQELQESAFKAGFYAGAAEERKDGTPYPFRSWSACFIEWSKKHETEDMELAVPRKLSTGEEIADRAGKEYLRHVRDLPNPPYAFQKPDYGSGSASQTVPRGSTKTEGEAQEIPGDKSNYDNSSPTIFDSVTADAVRRQRELTGLGLAECRKNMEIDILVNSLQSCQTSPGALHQGYAVARLYDAVQYLLKRARNGSQ